MSLANGELGMSWLEMWWDETTLALARRPSPVPTDGAAWLMYVLDFGKAGLMNG